MNVELAVRSALVTGDTAATNDQLWACTLRSDESLVALAKAGAHLAFAELCDRHRERAYRFAYRITRNKEDAEDAVQESLLKVLTHLQTFDGRSTFSTWFMRIATNSALMTLRKKRVRTYLSLEEECLHPPQESHPSSNPQLHLLQQECEELVKAAICRLPPTLRSVTEIRYSLDISLCEVAKLEGISVAAAKSRLMRARKFLNRALCKFRKDKLNQGSLKLR
jgi:RNA polymerase sigma-70 factor (ECF subfamily)